MFKFEDLEVLTKEQMTLRAELDQLKSKFYQLKSDFYAMRATHSATGSSEKMAIIKTEIDKSNLH